MSDSNKVDYNEVTENIRKAFRLLFGFTMTFHSVVKFIQAELDLNFVGDWQNGTPPQNKRRNLDNKYYHEWFPLYYHVYDFVKGSVRKGNAYSFSIILQCDTGYYDYYTAENYASSAEIEAKDYANVSEAKTKVIFGAVNKADIDIGKIFNDAIDDNISKYWSIMTKDCKKDFSLPSSKKGDNEIFYRVYELSDFKDKEATINTVNDFVAYLNKNGVTGFESISAH